MKVVTAETQQPTDKNSFKGDPTALGYIIGKVWQLPVATEGTQVAVEHVGAIIRSVVRKY